MRALIDLHHEGKVQFNLALAELVPTMMAYRTLTPEQRAQFDAEFVEFVNI